MLRGFGHIRLPKGQVSRTIIHFIFFFLAFAFSDLYYPAGRYFDYLVILIAIFSLVKMKYSVRNLIKHTLLVVLFFCPWFIAAVLNGNILLSSAILVGLVIVLPATYQIVIKSTANFDSIVELIIILLVSSFYIQLAFFYLFNEYLDYTSYFGSIPGRPLYGFGYFRPHGLMQEPNAYSTVLLTLLFIYSKTNRVRYFVVVISFLSILLSLSLWGIIMAPLFWILFFYRYISWRFFSFVAIIGVIIIPDLMEFREYAEIAKRLSFSEDDPSRDARYGSLDLVFRQSSIIFGNGFNSNLFQEFGANGFSFLLSSLGIVGLMVMIVLLMVQSGLLFRDLLMLGLIFTTFPIASYMFLYVAIGSIMALNKLRCAEYTVG